MRSSLTTNAAGPPSRSRGCCNAYVLGMLALAAWLAAADVRAFDPGTAGPLPSSGTVEVAFSPWDDTEGLVLRAVRGARNDIYVQAYIFTSRKLAKALIDAKERGLTVEVLADREMLMKYEGSRIPELAEAGVPVRLEFRYPAAHNKVIVIDPLLPENAVVTGSFNFTYAARAKNAENVLVLRGNSALALAYYHNFLRHREGAIPYTAALPLER